jgi:hypothetical protein
MKLIISDNKKYGILRKGSVFDINTFEIIDVNKYYNLRSGKLQHLPNKEFDKELFRKAKGLFPYTTVGNTYVFHINLRQKFFIKINKDNTMNIYSGYPIFVLKRLIKFIDGLH